MHGCKRSWITGRGRGAEGSKREKIENSVKAKSAVVDRGERRNKCGKTEGGDEVREEVEHEESKKWEEGTKRGTKKESRAGERMEEGEEKLGRRFRGMCPWRLNTPQPLTNRSSTHG